MYKAVKNLDFYYLVEDDYNEYPDGIELTDEEYEYLLSEHQRTGNMIRMSKGELMLCEINQPSQYHIWNEEAGEWDISKEDIRSLLLDESRALLAEKKQVEADIELAELLDDLELIEDSQARLIEINARIAEIKDELKK